MPFVFKRLIDHYLCFDVDGFSQDIISLWSTANAWRRISWGVGSADLSRIKLQKLQKPTDFVHCHRYHRPDLRSTAMHMTGLGKCGEGVDSKSDIDHQ